MTPTETAEAMIEAHYERYETVGPFEDSAPACLAAALRALPPDADLAAVIEALEAAT
jgi:hypothetical protein